MADRSQLNYGGVPVPYTVSWSNEEATHHIAQCPYSGQKALSQNERRGAGKPQFGKPHSNRQREAITLGLCDLCGRSLKTATKVSLSHARVVPHGAEGPAILQVEPLLHRQCAEISMRHCPSLRRDIGNGTLFVRQVLRYRVQFAVMDEVYTMKMTGRRMKAIGHAKVELLRWLDRDAAWLGGAADA